MNDKDVKLGQKDKISRENAGAQIIKGKNLREDTRMDANRVNLNSLPCRQ